MKVLYLDCFCGISGDMTVAALLDAGADYSLIQHAIASMNLEGLRIEKDQVYKKGIQAARFHVLVDPGVKQPHRHLHHILEIIEKADMPQAVKEKAAGVFQCLGEAEAEVHGTTVAKVHFHEVGALDSIVDIVAANLALHSLGVEKVISSPLVTGQGTVACDHGIMPVPAPATAVLLKGIPWHSGGVDGELVTPTGAALVRHWADSFGGADFSEVNAIGHGAGTRDLPDRANVLRVFVGTAQQIPAASDHVNVVETMVDNLNPELAAVIIPALLEAGALDAWTVPVQAKKGRTGLHITALCDDAALSRVTDSLFVQSGTLGIRFRQEARRILEREAVMLSTPWGDVRGKRSRLRTLIENSTPEYEDCAMLAAQHGIPVRKVYEAALADSVKGGSV